MMDHVVMSRYSSAFGYGEPWIYRTRER